MDYIRKAENYLRHYRDLKHSVVNMSREIARLQYRTAPSEDVGAAKMDPTGVRADDVSNTYNDLYRLQTLAASLEETKEALQHIDEILEEMGQWSLQERDRRILELWYVENKEKEEICEELKISIRHLYREKERSIRKFAIKLWGLPALKSS